MKYCQKNVTKDLLCLLLSAGLMLKYWKDRVLSEQGETGVVQLLLLEPGNRPFAAGAM